MVPCRRFETGEIPQIFPAIELLQSNVLVDVSVLCAVAFEKYVCTHRLLRTFGTIVIPLTPDTYGEHAAISTLNWVRECDVDPARVRLVFNRADPLKPVQSQFNAVCRFVENNREFENISLNCVLPESDIFNRAYHRYSVGSLLWNTVDYRAQRIAVRRRGATEHELAELSTLQVEQRIAQGIKPLIERSIGSLKLTPRS
jgi:hypothetical protein